MIKAILNKIIASNGRCLEILLWNICGVALFVILALLLAGVRESAIWAMWIAVASQVILAIVTLGLAALALVRRWAYARLAVTFGITWAILLFSYAPTPPLRALYENSEYTTVDAFRICFHTLALAVCFMALVSRKSRHEPGTPHDSG